MILNQPSIEQLHTLNKTVFIIFYSQFSQFKVWEPDRKNNEES